MAGVLNAVVKPPNPGVMKLVPGVNRPNPEFVRGVLNPGVNPPKPKFKPEVRLPFVVRLNEELKAAFPKGDDELKFRVKAVIPEEGVTLRVNIRLEVLEKLPPAPKLTPELKRGPKPPRKPPRPRWA
jgi:hypothetical protein